MTLTTDGNLYSRFFIEQGQPQPPTTYNFDYWLDGSLVLENPGELDSFDHWLEGSLVFGN